VTQTKGSYYLRNSFAGAVNWCAVDAREDADGEVDEVRRVAESAGCTFVDGRKTPHLACPSCTSELDLVDHLGTRLLAV
jgi:hypothetical protein